MWCTCITWVYSGLQAFDSFWTPVVCLGSPQMTLSAGISSRDAPLQRQTLFPPHPAIFNFAFFSSAGR